MKKFLAISFFAFQYNIGTCQNSAEESIDSLIRKVAVVTISYADTNVFVKGEPKPVSNRNTHHYCVTYQKDLVLVRSNLSEKNKRHKAERILWFYFFENKLIKVEFRYVLDDEIAFDVNYYYNKSSFIGLTKESGKNKYGKIVRNQKKKNLLIAGGLLDKFNNTIYKKIHW